MSVDTEDRPTNVKGLALEAPPIADLRFVMEREITEDDWKMLRSGLDNLVAETKSIGFPRFGMGFLRSAALIAPEDVYSRMDDEMWEKMRAERNRMMSDDPGNPTLKKLEMGVVMKLSLPEKAKEEELFDEADWQMLRHLLITQSPIDIRFTLETLASARLLDSERAAEFEIFPGTWDLIKAKVEELEKARLYSELSEIIQAIKIIDSKKMKEIRLRDESWKGIWESQRSVFGAFRPPDGEPIPVAFVYQTSKMAILAADEVQVTDMGVKLVFPKSKEVFVPPVPQVPAVKKY